MLRHTGTMLINRRLHNGLKSRHDPGGNLGYISYEGENTGYVYLGDHEMENTRLGYSNLILISTSFNALIESLSDEL